MSEYDPAARWDQRYATTEYFYGTAANEFLREQVAALPVGGQVLCIGDGEGRNGVYLAALGFRVVSLDASAVGLAKAARLAQQRGVALGTVHADLERYAIATAAWDGIVSIWCHLPPTLRRRVYREIVAGLLPGGALLLTAYTLAQRACGTGGPREPELLPSLTELRAELAGLRFDTAVERERPVHEGGAHRGLSAVVEIVARQPA